MGTTLVQEQSADLQPPRRGECFALAVDSTTRSYGLSGLPFGGITPEEGLSRRLETFVTLRAVGQDVWYYFSQTSATDLLDTSAIAAGGALAYQSPQGFVLPAGQEVRFRLDRTRDRFLIVKTAATTGTLLFRMSSNPGVA